MLLQKSPLSVISKIHASARVSWCEKYREKTAHDWAQVIFSDESSIEIGRQSRQIRVWRHTGERFNIECLTPTFKSGRKSVMFCRRNKSAIGFS